MTAKEQKKPPHAEFFEKIFSDRANTIDFIKGVFPKDLLQHLKPGTIKRDSGSYITGQLSRFMSDIVYSCRLKGRDIKIVLLFEHKSAPEKYIHT